MKIRQNQTLDRGLDILLLFGDANSSLNITEMVERLEIPRSTVYRFVQVLKQKGLLESIGHGFYQPGWLAVELARVVGLRSNLIDISLPIMQALSKETREAVALTIPFGTKARVIEHVDSPQQLQLSYKTGQERPLHKGSPSKIILAYLEKHHRQIVISKIEDDFDVSTLEKEMKRIRDQGYVVTSNEVDEGARGVSAPIFRSNKSIVAGINIAGPISRINHHRLPEIIRSVKKAAEEITKLLEIT